MSLTTVTKPCEVPFGFPLGRREKSISVSYPISEKKVELNVAYKL